MFTLFKRLTRVGEPGFKQPEAPQAADADTRPASGHDDEADELTPASWPTTRKAAEFFGWSGGCCG